MEGTQRYAEGQCIIKRPNDKSRASYAASGTGTQNFRGKMEGTGMIVMTPKLQEMMENLKISNAETYYHAVHVKYLTVKMIKKIMQIYQIIY